MAGNEHFLFSDPQCETPAKSGVIGALYLNETLRNKANWNQSVSEIPPQFVGGKTGMHFYSVYQVNNGEASTSPNTAWWSLNRVYAGYGLFTPNYTIIDDKTQVDTTKVPNAFFISKHDGTSPTEATFAGSCIVLQLQGDIQFNTEEGASNGVGYKFIQYGQNPSPSDGERTQWDYFTSNTQQLYSGSITQYNNSQYSNIGFAKITLPWGTDGEPIEFIAFVGNFNDSGDFRQSSSIYGGVIQLFPAELWSDSQRIPDPYAPEPEGNPDTGFDIADLPRTATGYSSLTDRSPYGLNTSDTGHVYLSSANYSKLIASIFGRNFNGNYGGTQSITDEDIQGQSYTEFQKIVEYTKSAMNNTVLDIAADMAVNSLAKSLGITEKIRNAMIDGILNAHIFPAVFSGSSAPITTLSGYDLKTTVAANAISPEIAEASFTATIPRPSTSFLGYEPYTKITVFAPFIGSIDVPASVLFNGGITGAVVKQNTRPDSGTVGLYYQIDSYTGLCSCQVYLNGNFYTERQGMCAASIPIVGAAKTGAAAKGIISAVSSIMSGGVGGVLGAVGSLTEGLTAPSTAPIIGGSSANIAALLSKRTPVWHMTYKAPAMPNPSNYAPILGGMTNQKGTVGSYSGFCQFYDADLSAVSAPQSVKEQILQHLKQGVFL